MHLKYRLLSSLSLTALLITSVGDTNAQRGGQDRFKPPFAKIQSARVLEYDVRHLKVYFDVDYPTKSAAGVVSHYLTPLKPNLDSIAIDAKDNLKIEAVTINGIAVQFKHEKNMLHITPASPLGTGKEVIVEIKYKMPYTRSQGGLMGARGIHWIDPTPNNPERRPGFWTQGETTTNSHWVPLFEGAHDKVTTETIVTVPDTWTVIGNGDELPAKTDAARKKKTFHWKIDKPHSTYLLSLAAGEMDVKRDKWRDIPLIYAVPKGMGNKIEPSFGYTPDMMEFFSQKFGVKYPWSKYAQTSVFDFPGGMENVSATTLGVFLVDARSTPFQTSSLNAHELAHQWFGDLVTCKDWGDIWLNEGFATFGDMIYQEKLFGKEAYEDQRTGALRGYLNESRRYKRPLATNMYGNPDDLFDSHAYPRGGFTVHMLRKELGDATFFRGIQHYLKKHAYQAVETKDLRLALSDVARRDLTGFFDQWVLKPGHPVIDWSWRYDAARRTLVVSIKQTQNTSEGTPIYNLPLTVAIIPQIGNQRSTKAIIAKTPVRLASEEISIRLDSAPAAVLLDPERDLLIETRDQTWNEEALPAILRFAPSHQDRQRAARLLVDSARGKSNETMEMILQAATVETSDSVAADMIRILAANSNETYRPFFRVQAQSKQYQRRAAALAAFGSLQRNPEDMAMLRQVALNNNELYSAVESALRSLAKLDIEGNLDAFENFMLEPTVSEQSLFRLIDLTKSSNSNSVTTLLVSAAQQKRSPFYRSTVLRTIGKRSPGSKQIGTLLMDFGKDGNHLLVQRTAIEVLQERKEKMALSFLRELAANAKDEDIRRKAKDAVENISTGS